MVTQNGFVCVEWIRKLDLLKAFVKIESSRKFEINFQKIYVFLQNVRIVFWGTVWKNNFTWAVLHEWDEELVLNVDIVVRRRDAVNHC